MLTHIGPRVIISSKGHESHQPSNWAPHANYKILACPCWVSNPKPLALETDALPLRSQIEVIFLFDITLVPSHGVVCDSGPGRQIGSVRQVIIVRSSVLGAQLFALVTPHVPHLWLRFWFVIVNRVKPRPWRGEVQLTKLPSLKHQYLSAVAQIFLYVMYILYCKISSLKHECKKCSTTRSFHI
jgi:hypothetical protein